MQLFWTPRIELGRAHLRNSSCADRLEDGRWNALSTAGGAILVLRPPRSVVVRANENTHLNCARQQQRKRLQKKELAGRTQRKSSLVLTRSSIRLSGDAGAAHASICRQASYGGLRVKRRASSAKPHTSLAWPFPPLMVQTGRCQLALEARSTVSSFYQSTSTPL